MAIFSHSSDAVHARETITADPDLLKVSLLVMVTCEHVSLAVGLPVISGVEGTVQSISIFEGNVSVGAKIKYEKNSKKFMEKYRTCVVYDIDLLSLGQ